jgi:hypothetical protein
MTRYGAVLSGRLRFSPDLSLLLRRDFLIPVEIRLKMAKVSWKNSLSIRCGRIHRIAYLGEGIRHGRRRDCAVFSGTKYAGPQEIGPGCLFCVCLPQNEDGIDRASRKNVLGGWQTRMATWSAILVIRSELSASVLQSLRPPDSGVGQFM